MPADNNWIVDDPRIAYIVRTKARVMSQQYGFRHRTQEDIAHDIIVGVLERSHNFNPGRGMRSTFVHQAVESTAASMHRARFSQKRNPRREGPSMNAPMTDRDGKVQQSEDAYADPADHTFMDFDVQHDKEVVLGKLTERDRQICDLRFEQASCRQIAWLVNISPLEVKESLTRIAEMFRDAGYAPD